MVIIIHIQNIYFLQILLYFIVSIILKLVKLQELANRFLMSEIIAS